MTHAWGLQSTPYSSAMGKKPWARAQASLLVLLCLEITDGLGWLGSAPGSLQIPGCRYCSSDPAALGGMFNQPPGELRHSSGGEPLDQMTLGGFLPTRDLPVQGLG